MLSPPFFQRGHRGCKRFSTGFQSEQESHCGSKLHPSPELIFTLLTLQAVPHFTDEETESQRSYVGLWSPREEPFSLADNFGFHSKVGASTFTLRIHRVCPITVTVTSLWPSWGQGPRLAHLRISSAEHRAKCWRNALDWMKNVREVAGSEF